jgi:hypothetical protein
MIALSPIANYVRRGRPQRAAALLSDQLPPAGSVELLSFGAEIGLKAPWLKRRGGAHEHFDLFGVRIELALKAGAVKIDRHRLAEIVLEKSAAVDRAVLLAKCGLTAERSFEVKMQPNTSSGPKRGSSSTSPVMRLGHALRTAAERSEGHGIASACVVGPIRGSNPQVPLGRSMPEPRGKADYRTQYEWFQDNNSASR